MIMSRLDTAEAEADRFAGNVPPFIVPLKANGLSLRAIADPLNARDCDGTRPQMGGNSSRRYSAARRLTPPP
jgi:hypothetical protein